MRRAGLIAGLWLVGLAASFAYGAAVVQFRLFPFEAMRGLKRAVVPELRLPAELPLRTMLN